MITNSPPTIRRQPTSWDTTSATIDYSGGNYRLVSIGSNATATVRRDFATNANEQHTLEYNLALLNGGSATVKVQQLVGSSYVDIADASQIHSASGSYTLTFTPTQANIRVVVSGTSRFALTQIFLDRPRMDEVTTTYMVKAGGYRYQFNGMEVDNEVKGSGNSYTTEFRQYDPRLGRWLSADPLAGAQPDQSPYKSFLNNPLRYGDKEGDTEYETYIIKNKQTGEFVKIYKKVSNNVKTDFVRHGKEYHYYDYRHVTYLTINEDGSETVTKATEILYRNGMKDKAHVFKPYPEFGYANPDEIKIIKDPYEMKGGWYMTSKLGQGTKYYSKNAEYIGDIDDLISPLGGLKSGSIKKYFDRVKSIVDGIQKATEAVEPYLNDSSTSDEMKNDEQSKGVRATEGDTTITINQWERGYGWTRNHTKDTTVKKSDVDKVERDRELPKAKY